MSMKHFELENFEIHIVPWESSKKCGYIRFGKPDGTYLGSIDEHDKVLLEAMKQAIEELLEAKNDLRIRNL